MKPRRNKWLSRTARFTGGESDDSIVRALIGRHSTENETLESIAARLGVGEIVYEPLSFDGGVYDLEGKRHIRINSLAAPTRQKFTLAHEIGHLMLERTAGVGAKCTTDKELERACDKTAAELLLPVEQVKSVASSLGEQSPEKLGVIAGRFGVSLQVAAQRLHDLGLWKKGVGMWKCDATATQKWYVGKRPWNTPSPSFAAFNMAIEANRPVVTTERFPKGPYTELVGLKAHHIGKHYVVAVVATIGK